VIRRSACALFGLLLPLLTVACGSSPHTYAGIVRDPTPHVDVAPLPDASSGGTPMRFRAAPGGLLVVYFGYTLCPDVCPTTMSDIRLALEDMPRDQRERVQVGLVTVDPNRDTSSVLRRYVGSFVKGGRALRTDDAALLKRVADAFGAAYDVTTVNGKVEVSHTAFTYAVDDHGRLLLQWSFGTRWQDMRADLSALLDTQTGGPAAAVTETDHPMKGNS
jgi:protein SCO1